MLDLWLLTILWGAAVECTSGKILRHYGIAVGHSFVGVTLAYRLQ